MKFYMNNFIEYIYKEIYKNASIRWQDSARRQFQVGLRGDVGL